MNFSTLSLLTRLRSARNFTHFLGETGRTELTRQVVQCTRLIFIDESLEEEEQREIANLFVFH